MRKQNRCGNTVLVEAGKLARRLLDICQDLAGAKPMADPPACAKVEDGRTALRPDVIGLPALKLSRKRCPPRVHNPPGNTGAVARGLIALIEAARLRQAHGASASSADAGSSPVSTPSEQHAAPQAAPADSLETAPAFEPCPTDAKEEPPKPAGIDVLSEEMHVSPRARPPEKHAATQCAGEASAARDDAPANEAAWRGAPQGQSPITRRVSFMLPEEQGSARPPEEPFAAVDNLQTMPEGRAHSPSPRKVLRHPRPHSPRGSRPASRQLTLLHTPGHLSSHNRHPQREQRGVPHALQEGNDEAEDAAGWEGGLLNLVRRLSYEKPARPSKRPRSLAWAPPSTAKQVPEAGVSLEQDYREAFLNSQLAASWRHGEAWAALDYYGLELGETAAARHQANCRQLAERVREASGAVAARALAELLEREWQQLKAMRQRYASAPAEGTVGSVPHATPPRSILKRRSPHMTAAPMGSRDTAQPPAPGECRPSSELHGLLMTVTSAVGA